MKIFLLYYIWEIMLNHCRVHHRLSRREGYLYSLGGVGGAAGDVNTPEKQGNERYINSTS